jgi:hypothetical protein
MQIDDLLRKLDAKEGEVNRMVEEKDQELAILQEGMDSTLQQMNDLRLVCMREGWVFALCMMLMYLLDPPEPWRKRQCLYRAGRHVDPRSAEGAQRDYR